MQKDVGFGQFKQKCMKILIFHRNLHENKGRDFATPSDQYNNKKYNFGIKSRHEFM